MKLDDIFNYEDPRDIFILVFHEKKKKNPLFSIRAWSRKMGFRNPSQVSDVLNGRRNLTKEFGMRVSQELDLCEEGRVFFETLVFLKNAVTPAEKAYYNLVLSKLRPERTNRAISPEKFTLVKEWYYGVLDEMTCLADFRNDPTYLAQRLGHEVNPKQIRSALADLIRLGSVEHGARGKLTRPRRVYFGTDMCDEVEHGFIRNYQRQFFEKALVALDEQSKSESYFRMSNIPIKAKHFPELRANIEEFVQSMNKKESSKDADDVYLLGVQFCRITKKNLH